MWCWPFVSSWWTLAPQACITPVRGWLPLVWWRGGKMQPKVHKLGLQTTLAVPWSFTWSWRYLRLAWKYSWCLQATWGMRLLCTHVVHWWTIFHPSPAALLPTVSAPSGRCGRLGLDILICTSYFWCSWVEWKVVGRCDLHSNWCCVPGLWWSDIEYSQRHVWQWGGTGTLLVSLSPLRSARIAW